MFISLGLEYSSPYMPPDIIRYSRTGLPGSFVFRWGRGDDVQNHTNGARQGILLCDGSKLRLESWIHWDHDTALELGVVAGGVWGRWEIVIVWILVWEMVRGYDMQQVL